MMKVANQVMYDIEFACIKFMGERTTTTFDDLRLDLIRNYVAKRKQFVQVSSTSFKMKRNSRQSFPTNETH